MPAPEPLPPAPAAPVAAHMRASILLQEVEIEFTGVERVDTSWVLPTYRRATPPINADKRKVGGMRRCMRRCHCCLHCCLTQCGASLHL